MTGCRRVDGTVAWTVPEGRWTLLRIRHVNAKRVNTPAPKEATGWECDKLAPEDIEAHFNGYIRKLVVGPLKGVVRGMLVDSWECFCQTWTPRMEQYFREANGYELRLKLPMLFGWVVDSPEKTQRFLNDWQRTIGDLITKNYYGQMAELAHAAGLKAYYETAFGDGRTGETMYVDYYALKPVAKGEVVATATVGTPLAVRGMAGLGKVFFMGTISLASVANTYATEQRKLFGCTAELAKDAVEYFTGVRLVEKTLGQGRRGENTFFRQARGVMPQAALKAEKKRAVDR